MSQELVTQTNIIAKAELDTQVFTAKTYPRKIIEFLDKAKEMATWSESIAESCIYCLTRKDKDNKVTEIRGPSIRLAEIMASSWKNIHTGSRIIDNDGKTITVEGVAWDLETNVKNTAQIQRSIRTNKGFLYSQDMQDKVALAAQSIARRNAILSVIPKAFVEEVYEEAKKKAIGTQQGFNEKRNTLFDRFNKMGIETSKILSYLELGSVQDITPEHVVLLIGIGTAIKDGDLKIDQAFNLQSDETIGMTASEKLQHDLSLKTKKSDGIS